MRGADAARLVTLAAIWGASFLFIRIATPAFGVLATADVRMLIAGGALAGYYAATGFDAQWRRWRRYCLAIGVLDCVLPFLLFGDVALCLVCGAIAYVLYFRLIADIGATGALTVTYLIPIFGFAWGALFLGEAITPAMLGGALVVILGTVLVLRN